MPSSYKQLNRGAHHSLPVYSDGTRIAWNVDHKRVWVSAGPSARDQLPTRVELDRLQRASLRR
jgi:hypothetical protein